MPNWIEGPEGKWKGGRAYLDDEGRKVFVIEKMIAGVRYTKRLETRDEDQALAELALFKRDPVAYLNPPRRLESAALFITPERLKLYLESIAHTVKDHRSARWSYLKAWGELRPAIDLRTVDRAALRAALAKFEGGHAGRVEALNAFARFMVKEGELAGWVPLVNYKPSAETRAKREAYTLEQLAETYARLGPRLVRDVFHLRCATGMHYTEIAQLVGAPVMTSPLPDNGAAIRTLPKGHEIAGVLQVRHKSRKIHRASVDKETLAAALRLRERVPDRITVWEKFAPLVPSNLRHTYSTLLGEVGREVTYRSAGIDRARIARALGHRAGSTMLADRYDKLQIPPMLVIPLPWLDANRVPVRRRRRTRA